MSEFACYSLFPIKYDNLYELYKKQRDAFWVPKEIDLEEDVQDWRHALTINDKQFLTHVLAFFAQADGIVLENIGTNFSGDTLIPEARLFYGIQEGIEAIHWEMYNILIETLIDNPQDKAKAFDAIENYPSIREKAVWMQKWMNKDIAYIDRLVAFACAEGIFFSAAFAAIYFYKKKGLMPGLCLSNKFISRDEGLHRDFGCEMVKLLINQGVVSNNILNIVQDAVNIEEHFVNDALNVELIGINSAQMNQYVRFVADHLLQALNQPKYYNDENPFDWMTMISLTSKQNFFEGRVSEYKKIQSDMIFDMSADF